MFLILFRSLCFNFMHYVQKNNLFLARLPGILPNWSENYRRYNFQAFRIFSENFRKYYISGNFTNPTVMQWIKIFYHCKNESWKLKVCRREYFRIHIIVFASQQIPRLSKTFNLNFQDFPVPKSFSKTLQVWKFYEKIPGLSRRKCTNISWQLRQYANKLIQSFVIIKSL